MKKTKGFKDEETKDNLKAEYVKKEEETPKVDSIGECAICLDNLSDIMLPCLHAFCNQCLEAWVGKQ
jgi:hypothetical protein